MSSAEGPSDLLCHLDDSQQHTGILLVAPVPCCNGVWQDTVHFATVDVFKQPDVPATEFEAVYPLDSLGYTNVQSKGRECMFSQPDSLGTVCEKVHGPAVDGLARTQVVECKPELKSRKSILVLTF